MPEDPGSSGTGGDGPPPADQTSQNPFSDAKNIVAFLITGFGAVLGFLGLKSDEISAVIRNEPNLAAVVGVLLLAGLLCAVAVVALPEDKERAFELNLAEFVGLLIASISGFALIAMRIRVGGESASDFSDIVIVGIAIVVGAALFGFGQYLRYHHASVAKRNTEIVKEGGSEEDLQSPHWKRWARHVPTSFLLLVFALVFVAMSTYSALRLESVSQQTPVTEIAASITNESQTSPMANLSITVSTERILDGRYVYVRVFGLPTSVRYQAQCANTTPHADGQGTCDETPCSYLNVCELIATWKTGTDFNGSLDRTENFEVSSARYERIHIEAEVCQPVVISGTSTATTSTGSTTTTTTQPDEVGAGCTAQIPTFEDVNLLHYDPPAAATTTTWPKATWRRSQLPVLG